MSAVATAALVLLYLLPVALLAVLLTNERQRPPWLLTALLVALPLFYVGHYQLLLAIQGWPSEGPLPEEFRLLAFDIREPDPKAAHDGEILMWVRDTAGGQARVHRLEYRKDLHESLVAAGRAQAEGSPQVGTRRRPGGAGTAGAPARAPAAISFRREPPPSLPAKESTL